MTPLDLMSDILDLFLGSSLLVMPYLTPATLPFGVRVPYERIKDPRIPLLRRRFILRGVAILVLVLLVNFTVLNRPGASAALLPVGIYTFLLLGFLNYYETHRRLQRLKNGEQWYKGIRSGAAAIVGEEPSADRPPAHWAWFVPALALVALTLITGIWRYPHLPTTLVVHYGLNGKPNGFARKTLISAFNPVLMEGLMTALLMLGAFYGMGSRRDVDPTLPRTSILQQQIFRTRTGMLIAGLTVLLDLLLTLTAFTIWGLMRIPSGLTWWLLFPTVLPIVIVLGVAWMTGQSGSRVATPPEQPTGLNYRDDDRYWLGGQLYVNRADPAIFVPKRYGFGWTLNVANPVAWIILAALMALPLLSVVLASRG